MPKLKNNSQIDELVFSKLKELNIPPSEICPDEVFVRRAYFDVIGTLPSLSEVKSFLNNDDLQKRSRLIDELLKRKEYADYWAMKWCDLLRVKSEFPSNLWPNAVQAYYDWIKGALKQNMAYDRFVRELLLSSGSNFRVGPVNFYRAISDKEPFKIAEAAALTFMGARMKNWTKEQQLGMASFFTKTAYKSTLEWKEEIIYFNPDKPLPSAFSNSAQNSGTSITALLPDNKTISIPLDKDPRILFVNWLITPENPWFAKNIVNRIWSWLLGRGIIHEPDDIRDDNPPQNPKLLTFLEKELINNKYDMKAIFKLILNSKTYQLSSEHNAKNVKDLVNFSHYYPRRLEAEVLIDAICKITGTKEEYSSPIPEPFTFIPADQRSISLADGSITSSFLEMFGRSPRDTGFESERNINPSSTQLLHLLNSSHILNKLEKTQKSKNSSYKNKSNSEAIDTIYLTVLSRYPDENEKKIINKYMDSGQVRLKDALFDITWALINTKEFMFRH